LVERDRNVYIDAGFDGWILKPISFDRLSEILLGIVDEPQRKKDIYKIGVWEKGGWFSGKQKSIFDADTKPDDHLPMSAPSKGVIKAARDDDPFIKEDDDSTQTKEQKRLLENQQATM